MDLPDINVEFQAKIAKAMADMEILKKQIKSVSDTAARTKLSDAAKAFEKSLTSGAATSAVADMYKKVRSDSDKAGKDSARSFWAAFKKELKNEKNPFNVPGWLPLVGLAMPAAPAAITGLAGALGALGTAGLGAAAGIAAVGASAMEVLAPVKQAFTTIDQLGTTNAVKANATALQIWLKSASKVAAVSAGGGSGFTVAAENARIAMLQGRIRNATTPTAAANYAAELAAAQRHLAKLTGGSTAGGGSVANSLGPGLGFLANTNVNYATMTAKQRQALVLASQSTTGMPNSEKKQIEALMAERQAYTALNPAQRKALTQYTKFDQGMVGAQQQSQPQVMAIFAAGLKALTPLLKFLHPLAVAATSALLPLIKAFGTLFASKGMATFMTNLGRMSKLGISVFGGALLDFLKGFMNIFDAFSKSPVMKIVTNDFLEMAKAFATDTGKKGGGFSVFMNEVKQNAPVIDNLLRNLVGILGHLITSMGSGFGTVELKGLNMFFGLLNKISGIPGLGPLVYNLTALTLITSKFGSFKLIGAFVDTIGKGVARMAALKFGTMIAGMIGLDTEGMGVADMFKAIGKNVLTFAGNMAKSIGSALLSMTKWVGAMLIQGAKWVAGMVVEGVTVAASWIASAATAAAAWIAANAAMIIASGGIVLLIGAIVIAVYLLVKHWKTVWGEIQRIAKDAWRFIWDGFGKYLLPLLGPVGLIALGAIELAKHWKTITNNIKGDANSLWQHLVGWGDDIRNLFTKEMPHWFDVAVHAVATAFDRIRDAVKAPVNWVITHVLDGLIGAFDWISGKVGGPHINKIPGLAKGARIPGFGGGDRHLRLLEGGEAVVSKETTARHARELSMWGVPGMASGGLVGQSPPGPTGNPKLPQGQPNPGGGIGGIFRKIGDIAKITAAVFSGNNKALTNAITDMLPGGVGGAVADMSSLLTDATKDLISNAVKALISSGSGGASAQAIVGYAMRFIGRIPYVWGGTAVPGGADCSGFTQAIYKHFGINAPRTSEEQGAWVKRGPARAGDLAFYHSPAGGPDPGHVGIVRNANSVISQGGGMGPQVIGLHALPLLWTGSPPGGFGAAGGGAAGPGVAGAETYATRRMRAYGWSTGQMGSLKPLWTRESGWNRFARNPSSGAYGIPQALPPTKMPFAAQAGGGSQAGPQIDWGLNYIKTRPGYGSPAAAWAHEQAFGWYGNGLQNGIFNQPTVIGVGERGPERVDITPLSRGRKPGMESGTPVFIQVNTQEIRPQFHAAQLGWELARRAS
jgi:cell wall-associated NlpC family hydrolase